MRRTIKILSFICLIWACIGGVKALRQLPADTGAYVEKKYAGWSGVLRCWVYSDWRCGGSFISWLNSCAEGFERAHEGVYLEFETVSAAAMDAPGMHPPDMRITSVGEGQPIARGGYIRVENPSATGTAIQPEHCGAFIAMLGRDDQPPVESGIDLGLTAMNQGESIRIDSNAFQSFINGELGATIVDQYQLSKLIALKDSGRGPDWRCVVSGGYSWAGPQLCLQVDAEDSERAALCQSFLEWILTDDQQAALRRIGAFPVTGAPAYDDFSPYRPMEIQGAKTPIFPKPEHSHADHAAIVREVSEGRISAEEAIERLL